MMAVIYRELPAATILREAGSIGNGRIDSLSALNVCSILSKMKITRDWIAQIQGEEGWLGPE